jgi:AcrR family transcriptional regulator
MSLRQQKKAAVRQRILSVCKELFRSRGFDETTISDIIERVGISRQTFFNYFSGKEEVLTELGLAWLREQAMAPRIDARSARRGSILEGTRRAVMAQLAAIEADAGFMKLVFTRSGLLFPSESEASTPSDRVRSSHTRPIFEGIAMVMRMAQQAGEVRTDVDPLQIAEMYVSVMLMTTRFWLVDYWRDGVDLQTRGARALDVLEAGLTARRPGPPGT